MATQLPPQDTEQISEASTPSLFAGLISDARDLAVGHLERIRGEIGDEFRNLKAMMVRVAIAVGVMVVGAVLAGHFIAIALITLGLQPWASYGIAAMLAVVVAIVVVVRMPGGDRSDMDMIPEDSIAALRRDVSEVSAAARK